MVLDHPVAVVSAVFVVYLVLVSVLWRVNHVDYEALAESRESVVRGIVVPIGAAAVLVAVVTTVVGWWQPVLVQGTRPGPAWALVVPVLLTVMAVLGASSVGYTSPRRDILPLLAVGVLLVGFAEEVMTRGLLIVGARDAGWSETQVMLFSCALFALLHGINALFGQSVPRTLVQVGLTFAAGAAFYVTRMTTGTLVVCILLHALWDFGTLGTQATGRQLRPITLVVVPVVYVLALVAAWVLAGR